MSDLNSFDSIDSLLSANLDDLADLPAFETPPPGVYILDTSMDVKEVNGHQSVEQQFTVVETVELEDKSENAKHVVAGTKFSQLFLIDNEFGVGNLKKALAPFAAHFGTSNVGELVRDKVKEVRITAVVKNRKDKTDPDKIYASVSNVQVA